MCPDKTLKVKNLSITYRTGDRQGYPVWNASIEVGKGEVVGLVGESGCGKSTLAWSVLGLLPKNGRIAEGSILFQGRELANLEERSMDKIRGREIAMIIQNTQDSLNPVFSIGYQICDLLRLHSKGMNRQSRKQMCIDMLKEMEIGDPKRRFSNYPYQLSGGMRQRVMMSMAFIMEPVLILADEPTTGLDISVEAHIIELFKEKIEKFKTSVLYITHDLRLLNKIADRIVVMYAGTVVENAASKDLYANPCHPYTIELLNCLPEKSSPKARLQEIPGNVPSIFEPKEKCPFRERCSRRLDICNEERPPEVEISPSHLVRCHNWKNSKEGGI